MTGWPDETRPGVPLNPERDGWHWLAGVSGEPAALEWRASVLRPEVKGWYMHRAQHGVVYAPEMARWTYLGPCLTPDEVQSQLAAARREGAEEAGMSDRDTVSRRTRAALVEMEGKNDSTRWMPLPAPPQEDKAND